MNYWNHFYAWARRFPGSFVSIFAIIGLSIFEESLPKQQILDSLESGDFFTIQILIVLGLSIFEIFRAFRYRKRIFPKLPIYVKVPKSEKAIDAANQSFFLFTDAFSVWAVSVFLVVFALGIGTEEFGKAIFFANFYTLAIVPFISVIVYYGSYLRLQKNPRWHGYAP